MMSRTIFSRTTFGLALAAGVMGCASEASQASQANQTAEDGHLGAVGQEEAWGSADAPTLFSADIKRNLEQLPMSGQATTVPWAGSYWPTYQDNINHRWGGAQSDSPSKKYEKAFGGTGVEDAVSKNYGIDSRSSAKACAADAECNTADGEACAKREGATSGRCIPTWFGICHAWSPAAILIPEPKHEVVENGVTFKIQDLKALASLVHNSTSSKFVSLRCDDANDGKAISFDENGRPSEADKACRDTNPGTYHVLLANYLGLKGQAFVEDRTFDDEVWNQPLRGYKILEKKEVTGQQANALIGTPLQGTKSTVAGDVAKGVWFHQAAVTVTPGQSYRVVSKGTGDADLYVRFDAKPTTSTYACRPYLEGTNEECVGSVPAGVSKMYVSLRGYETTSSYSVDTTVGTAPATYAFNSAATKLIYVRNDVSYISEAPAETDGNLSSTIDKYTRVDHYEYILELDGAGEIIGGEWVGTSKTAHPDFVWLPTGVSSQTVAGGKISYATVKALLDRSVAPDGGTVPPSTTVQHLNVSDTVALGESKLYTVSVPAGFGLKISTTAPNDIDLYVRLGAAPTVTTYDARGYTDSGNETVLYTAPSAGTVNIVVRGYKASSFTLKTEAR